MMWKPPEIDLDALHGNLNPDIDEVYSRMGGDPAKYLVAFLAWSKSPKRYIIGFDRDSLRWVSEAWGAAASCMENGIIRDSCVHERDRYASLAKSHEVGEMLRREEGVTFLDRFEDWPRPEIIRAAVTALEKEGRRTLQ